MNSIIWKFPTLYRIRTFYSNFNSNLKSFAVKVGLATAAVYYIKEQGVWKNSDESIQTYERLKETARPYVQDLKKQLPIELPQLPETDRLSSLAKQSWNAGVLATFKFISELPQTVNTWTDRGIQKALENPDIKNFVDSFSSKKPIEQK